MSVKKAKQFKSIQILTLNVDIEATFILKLSEKNLESIFVGIGLSLCWVIT